MHNAINSPNTMREIGRLRELSFRQAGGGTGLECDLDGDNIPGCPGGTCQSVPGVLAFELEGDLTSSAPSGGCCDPDALDCNQLLVWGSSINNNKCLPYCVEGVTI